MAKGMKHMMRQMKKVQAEMERMQAEMAERTVEASAGGGMVTVVANGAQEIVSVKIEPEVVSADDVEMLEDLIVAAVNEAFRKVQEMMNAEGQKLIGGLGIPGLM